ncbi:hypothetical protein ACH5RR_016974 [Cinchona calisaya]|uniref:Protein kinase domain-containing protein n=1 Tax=Cinchona calisaya TaxID=153742 RepID=A0ABD3A0P3_9GENT
MEKVPSPWEFKVFFLSSLWLYILALAIIVCQAQDNSDFISIDCGLDDKQSDYVDEKTNIFYTADTNFIETGKNFKIERDYINSSIDKQLWTVRSFTESRRNCYNLSAVVQGKLGKKYLMRAMFLYGNYDGKNQIPKFDLHLGVELWDTVEINTTTSIVTKEIIHVFSSSNYTYVCLVNTDSGTPFISALELRPLNQDAYPTNTSHGNNSLVNFLRLNFAPESNEIIRYPEDKFDRLWRPFITPSYWSELRTSRSIDVSNHYQPPEVVMQSAVTSLDANQALRFYFTPPDPTIPFYVYLHFAEVLEQQSNESRAFDIHLNDKRWYDDVVLKNFSILTIYVTAGGTTEASFNYSLVRTENSTLPPIINAMEVYLAKMFVQSQTDENDVWAILNIKSTYGLNRNWQGDPCFPREYMWEGLGCTINTNNESSPPRIKSLNFSSSGLSGNVSSYLSKLNFLEALDLSNNSFNGSVPDFLADLPLLKVLNLSGNQFSGSIPQKLLDKAKSGLELSADGYPVGIGSPNPCDLGQCKRKKSNKFVVPLVVSLTVAASLIVLGALIVMWKLRTKRQVLGGKSNIKDGFLEKRNIQFTYSDILKITNNFQRVLGKGGFGIVYHGRLTNGEQVAVKLLSHSSIQGHNEFQTEVELLTRIHHRNLTSLVGYCHEDTNTALVYEFMANGNLREHLSVTHNTNILSWLGRLQIALDAAQGLDYLHNGCKPPIIHRDIKSTNILLNENFEAKLADFGLSRVFTIADGSSLASRVVGTPGYLDPRYRETQRLNEKTDIYSLGIVILELITGRPVITRTEEKQHITQWVSYLLERGDIGSIVDPKLNGMYGTNSVWKALEVAVAMASPTSYRRPNMAHVLTELTESLLAEKARLDGLGTNFSKDILEVNSEILKFEPGPK